MVTIASDTETVTRTVTEEVTVYNIQLTENEARVLLSVFARVGGNPNGPKGVTQDIFDTLKSLGVPFNILRNRHVSSGSISLDTSWERFLNDGS